MHFGSRLRTYTVIVLGAALLAMAWFTTAFAQAAGGDGDAGDGDEFSALALLHGVAAIAVVGWLAFQRRSRRPR
jgi:hypothetical protein